MLSHNLSQSVTSPAAANNKVWCLLGMGISLRCMFPAKTVRYVNVYDDVDCTALAKAS